MRELYSDCQAGVIVMKLPADHAEDVIVYAFRYALGRTTFASMVMAETLASVWSELSPKTRSLIRREIIDAISAGHAGQDCDVASWREVLALP